MTLATWVLSALGILVLWLISKGSRPGWHLGLGVDALYVAYFVHTHQWGLVPSSLAYAVVRVAYLRKGKRMSLPPLPPARVNMFIAMYDSECSECLLDIYAGDVAGFIYNDVCCETCCAEWKAMCDGD